MDRETVLDIDGMTCSKCVKHVEDALRQLPGVERVQVDLADGKAVVGHNASVVLAGLLAAVDDAGYEAKPRP
jgi:copper chaperone CopZ